MVWAKKYAEEFINTEVGVEGYVKAQTKTPKMSNRVRGQLQYRAKAYDAFCKEQKGAKVLLGELYSMVTPFTSYSPKAHTDDQDDDYSILANFGASCWLELPQYKVRIHVAPYDLVIFLSSKVKHSTTPVDSDKDSDKRWAVSYYQRKSITKQNAASMAAQASAQEAARNSDPYFAMGKAAEDRVF